MGKAEVGVVSKKNKDNTKRNSNGLLATFRAIRQFWRLPGFEKQEGGRSYDEFAAVYETKFREIASQYGGLGKQKSKVERTISNTENDERVATFIDMRAFAAYIGLPTGIVLFFTQMVSDEGLMRNDPNFKGSITEDLLSKTEFAISALKALEDHLKTCTAENKICDLLLPVANEPSATVANIRVLEKMTDAYQKRNVGRNVPR
jgi:hypothetical protein